MMLESRTKRQATAPARIGLTNAYPQGNVCSAYRARAKFTQKGAP
jgi:hypothetical protein